MVDTIKVRFTGTPRAHVSVGRRLTLADGVRFYHNGFGNCKAEAELPKLLWGHNGRLLANQMELEQSVERFRSILSQQVEFSPWQLVLIDLVWQFEARTADIILAHQEPLAAHRVEGDDHAGFEQLFGRHTGTAGVGVKRREEGRKPLEHGIHAAFDGAQRMVGGHALVEVDHRQEVRLSLGFSTHGVQTHTQSLCSNVFQQPVKEVVLPNMPLRYAVEVVSPQGWTVRLQNTSEIQSLPQLLQALPC